MGAAVHGRGRGRGSGRGVGPKGGGGGGPVAGSEWEHDSEPHGYYGPGRDYGD